MKALFPQMDKSRNRPFYLQLYDYMKDQILSGEIPAGEKLPSLRNFAKSTGLSLTTVEQCYNQLMVEGYIYAKPQSGYFVDEINIDKSSRGLSVPLKNGLIDNELSLSSEKESNVTPLRYDPDCFNFNKWKKCMNKILTEYSSALHFEGQPQGEIALRNEIVKYLYTSRGVTCTPEQIVIGAGTQQITSQLATLLRKMNIEHVALETPVYKPVRNSFRDRGFAITPIPIESNGLLIEKLPTNIHTAVYVSPSNNTFTGAVMPVGRRYQLIKWAEANDSYIIEDDYDSELRYFGKPIPALCSLNHNNRVVYLGSFSSTLFSAVKISYMVLPEPMARIFASISGDYSQTCSKLEQLTLALFMETGQYQTHIKKLRKLYSQKLTQVSNIFSSEGSDFIKVSSTNSGINLILDIATSKSSAQLVGEAAQFGIRSVRAFEAPINHQSILFYYNQIPLEEIPDVISSLIAKWRQE